MRDPLNRPKYNMPWGDHNYYVYIMTNQRHSVFYVGVTNSIAGRAWQHKNKAHAGFTKKYKIDKLVYYEYFDDIEAAITREKQLKKYSRQKKIILIEKMNSQWKDLFDALGN